MEPVDRNRYSLPLAPVSGKSTVVVSWIAADIWLATKRSQMSS